MSSERQHAVDQLARTFATATNYDNSEFTTYHKKIPGHLKSFYNESTNTFGHIPEDNPVMIHLRSLKLKSTSACVATGYYKHPVRNEYLYISIGSEMGYRTNHMFGKRTYYQWLVTNQTIPNLGMVTVWLYSGSEPEKCVDRPPTLSLFVLSRLVIFRNRCLTNMYVPGGRGFCSAQIRFNKSYGNRTHKTPIEL